MNKYIKLAKEYLASHPFCEVHWEGCTGRATEIHHKKGRGILTLVVKYFLAVCHNCHTIITEDSKRALAEGFSISRLKKEQDENEN